MAYLVYKRLQDSMDCLGNLANNVRIFDLQNIAKNIYVCIFTNFFLNCSKIFFTYLHNLEDIDKSPDHLRPNNIPMEI